MTPIEIAANTGETDIVKVLAPIIKWDCTQTNELFDLRPIVRAAKYGHTDIVKFLAQDLEDKNPPRRINRLANVGLM